MHNGTPESTNQRAFPGQQAGGHPIIEHNPETHTGHASGHDDNIYCRRTKSQISTSRRNTNVKGF